jgi:hypothetical protein
MPLVLQMTARHKVGTGRSARPPIKTDSVAAKTAAVESIIPIGAPSRSTLSLVKPHVHLSEEAAVYPDTACVNNAPSNIHNSIGANQNGLASSSKTSNGGDDEHTANTAKSDKRYRGHAADGPRKPEKTTRQAAKRKKTTPAVLENKNDVACPITGSEPRTKR